MSGLRDELHRLEEGVRVPHTQAAEGAWSTARRRVRRRRVAAVGGVAAAVVAAAVGLQTLTDRPADVQPAPLPPTRDSLVEVASPTVEGERLDPLLRDALPERRGDLDPTPLAEDPLEGPAAYVAGVGRRELRIVGTDGRARSITGLERIVNGAQPLRSGSLSPDAAMLVVPQPGTVLVADLQAGTTTSVDVGGISNTDVAWLDADTVAVHFGRLVATLDVAPGLTREEMEASVSDIVGTGLPVVGLPGVEWYPGVPGLVVDGKDVRVPSVRQESSSLTGPVPVAGDGWVAVAADPSEDSGLPRGVAVIDTASGRPRAFLPMRAIGSPASSGGGLRVTDYSPPRVAPLAVEGGTTLVVGMQTTYGVLVLRWDWASDALTGLVAEDAGGLPEGTAISWGVGLD